MVPASLHVVRHPIAHILCSRAGENSPFQSETRYAAIYANHCSRPNARVETWPVLSPGPYEPRQHMMIVAIEMIDAGAEGIPHCTAPSACAGARCWPTL